MHPPVAWGQWCGRPDSNRHELFSPTDFRTTSAFAASRWHVTLPGIRGLDYPFTVAFAVGAARLVSTPSRRRAWLGIAIAGFPEFEQFCVAGFPARTQAFRLSPMRLPIPPRPRNLLKYSG